MIAHEDGSDNHGKFGDVGPERDDKQADNKGGDIEEIGEV